MLTAYMDESYSDGLLMCVGGWFCDNKKWDAIQNQWQKRIDFENRQSLKKNLPPISRYHASKLFAPKGEFSGWENTRKIQFTKKLINILGREGDRLKNPIAVACGLKLMDVPPQMRGSDDVFKNHWAAYRLCMIQNLLSIS